MGTAEETDGLPTGWETGQDSHAEVSQRMRAWLFQDDRQKRRHGDNAPWSVGWLDPNGQRRSKRIGSKCQARRFQRKLEGEMAAGLYVPTKFMSWSEFRQEDKNRVLGNLKSTSRTEAVTDLNHFERIAKPAKVSAISTAMRLATRFGGRKPFCVIRLESHFVTSARHARMFYAASDRP